MQHRSHLKSLSFWNMPISYIYVLRFFVVVVVVAPMTMNWHAVVVLRIHWNRNRALRNAILFDWWNSTIKCNVKWKSASTSIVQKYFLLFIEWNGCSHNYGEIKCLSDLKCCCLNRLLSLNFRIESPLFVCALCIIYLFFVVSIDAFHIVRMYWLDWHILCLIQSVCLSDHKHKTEYLDKIILYWFAPKAGYWIHIHRKKKTSNKFIFYPKILIQTAPYSHHSHLWCQTTYISANIIHQFDCCLHATLMDVVNTDVRCSHNGFGASDARVA